MRVLLIEDEPTTARAIELMLTTEGFNVYSTDLGEEGLDLGKLYDYDIILLDLNLPDMSGFEVLRSLRVSKVKTPILILSGLAGIEDKVKGLGFGADDYMTKPFHKDELVARIHAIVRRSKGHAQSVIQTGDLVVNLVFGVVLASGPGLLLLKFAVEQQRANAHDRVHRGTHIVADPGEHPGPGGGGSQVHRVESSEEQEHCAEDDVRHFVHLLSRVFRCPPCSNRSAKRIRGGENRVTFRKCWQCPLEGGNGSGGAVPGGSYAKRNRCAEYRE